MKITAETQMAVHTHTHTHTSDLIKNKINNQKDGSIMPVCDTG